MPVSKMREETGLSDYKVRKWLDILDEKKVGAEDGERTSNEVNN